MEYAKKMIVVPPELISRLQKQQQGQSGNERSSRLDDEMHRILNEKGLDDNEKWKMYQQVLHRHLQSTAQNREPITLPIVNTEMGEYDDRMQRTAVALVDEVVETFPKSYKQDARNMLKAMARGGNYISWESDGTVHVKGEKIPNSNIVDILHSIVRIRKEANKPTGWEKVMSAIKEMNIPREYISNADALSFLGHQPREDSILFTASPASLYQRATPTISLLNNSLASSPLKRRHSRPYERSEGTSSASRWESFTPSRRQHK